MKKICVIGLGNMGKAIFDILNKSGKFEVKGSDRGGDIKSMILWSNFFIIAVKPQDFEELAQSIFSDLRDKVAISIMAGVSIKRILKSLKIKKVVRVMPNLPLKVGKAFSGWICTKNISKEEKIVIKEILKLLGEEIEVDDEEKIDAITALSGSGPAYFYYLAEMIFNSALKYGFSLVEAKKIAKNTFIGSAYLAEKMDEDVKTLREKVTSKSGTTEAALKKLKEKKFDKIFNEAVFAAYKRAKELNKK